MISAVWPGLTKPMSRFDTIASISSRLSAGADDEQRLRRRHDAADGVDGELLHRPVDRRGQELQAGLARRLDQILREPGGLGLGLDEFVRHRAPELGGELARAAASIASSAASASFSRLFCDRELLLRSHQVLRFLR